MNLPYFPLASWDKVEEMILANGTRAIRQRLNKEIGTKGKVLRLSLCGFLWFCGLQYLGQSFGFNQSKLN